MGRLCLEESMSRSHLCLELLVMMMIKFVSTFQKLFLKSHLSAAAGFVEVAQPSETSHWTLIIKANARSLLTFFMNDANGNILLDIKLLYIT